jgi:SAM-dependent methyltransferase
VDELLGGLTPPVVRRLAAALRAVDYTYDAVADLLGATAHAALSRNETNPGLRRTGDGSPLATLTRIWPLQSGVPVADAERALPGLVEPLCAAGLLERSGGEVRALLDLRPYADEQRTWWLVSDLTPGLDGAAVRVTEDHVLGVSSASSSLAQLTVRDPVGRALDLGTGCGVQALHLVEHAREVVATDVNRRALAVTRLNALLNDVLIDVREGDRFAPVDGELFDLVVTNPPFVVSPATAGAPRLVYRDSGLPGDDMVRSVVREAPRHLRPGGTAQVLANWVHTSGRTWQERVEAWLEGSGCDAWVVQREVADPAEYVELWLKDAGLHGAPDYARRYDAWLSWFEREGVTGVGFGWLNLRRVDREPVVVTEEWPFDVEQPLGPEVAARLRRADRLADPTFDLLGCRLVLREDVRQETFGRPGEADPETIVLRQQRGMRRAVTVDTVTAGLVGACDGDLTVGQILDALATLLDLDAAVLRVELPGRVSDLVAEGFLDLSGE